MSNVTVLMSTFNGEKYLREQIDTIITQDVTDMQLIVRDDGSTDETITVLKEYAETGTLKWYLGENEKECEKTNTKIGFSFLDLVKKSPESEYYAFADQDDIWDSQKLGEAIKMLEKEENKDIPLLYCGGFTAVDVEGNNVNFKNTHYKPKHTRLKHVIVRPIAPGCTFVFNKKARDLFADYNEEYIHIHDYALMVLVATFGKIIYDKRSFIKYRQHGGNALGTKSRSIISRIRRMLRNNQHAVSKTAQSMLNCYAAILDEKQLKFYKVPAQYRKKFRYKLKLLFTNHVKRKGFLGNLLYLKVAVILNKL